MTVVSVTFGGPHMFSSILDERVINILYIIGTSSGQTNQYYIITNVWYLLLCRSITLIVELNRR